MVILLFIKNSEKDTQNYPELLLKHLKERKRNSLILLKDQKPILNYTHEHFCSS